MSNERFLNLFDRCTIGMFSTYSVFDPNETRDWNIMYARTGRNMYIHVQVTKVDQQKAFACDGDYP